MNIKALEKKVNLALEDLGSKDFYLLQKDLHERTIAHQFALYLGHQFKNYQVDCEYNGNSASGNGRKMIDDMNHRLQQPNQDILGENRRILGGISHSEDENLADPIRVFPDIIVHWRGDNDHNVLAIEIKKSSNARYQEFDKQKLKAFTAERCAFKYDFGLFLEIGVKCRVLDNKMKWYENGAQLIIPSV